MDREIICSKYINLDLKATDARTAITEMAQLLFNQGAVSSVEAFRSDVFKREDALPTEMEWGISMPHARSAAVLAPCVAFGRSTDGFYWKEDSKCKTHMVFMFAVPESDTNNTHLNLISSVACGLLDEDFRNACIHAKTNEEVSSILNQAIRLSDD